ncbi:MAG: mitomycin antibiotic biosynthesis protein [Phycisphaera sp.]|nr:mitomycin antibiotic biosynthesis protein [Phycisphaera sp.]
MRPFKQEVEQFNRDNVVVARGVLDAHDLGPVIGDFEVFIDDKARELKDSGKITDPAEGLDFEHRVVALYAQNRAILAGMDIMQRRSKALFDFLHNAHLLDLVESFIGPEITCNPIQHARAKMPASVDGSSGFMNVPWHQDIGVTHEDSDQSLILTFWMPLVDATVQTGCMEVIPGCRRLGMFPHVSGKYGTEIDPDHMPDIPPVPAIAMKGDVVVMDKYTPHRGLPNQSDIARWSLDLRYQVTGHHTGRLAHPDFVVRSRSNPSSVKRDYDAWCQAWAQALDPANAGKHGPFHRTKARSM